jgi:hypothetical protein
LKRVFFFRFLILNFEPRPEEPLRERFEREVEFPPFVVVVVVALVVVVAEPFVAIGLIIGVLGFVVDVV